MTSIRDALKDLMAAYERLVRSNMPHYNARQMETFKPWRVAEYVAAERALKVLDSGLLIVNPNFKFGSPPPCGKACPQDEDCDNYGIGGEECPGLNPYAKTSGPSEK